MSLSISVILPNYNHGRYLDEALGLLLDQSTPPAEIIAVDDCSTDNSLDILNEYARRDPRVKVLAMPRNTGGPGAEAQALAMAQGDLTYHSAADDPVLKGFFQSAVEMLEKYPQAAFSICDYAHFMPNGARSIKRLDFSGQPSYISPEEFIAFVKRRPADDLPTHCGVWFRQKRLDCGGIPTQLRWHHDWFVALVAALRHGFCFAPKILKGLRWSYDSLSMKGQRDFEAQTEVLRSVFALLESPAYADVRDYFKLPNMLSRFGLILSHLLLSDENLWPYFSWEFFSQALSAENCFLHSVDLRSAGSMPRRAQVDLAKEVMERFARLVQERLWQYIKEHNYTEALDYAERLRNLMPDRPQPRVMLGSILANLGKPKPAEACFQKALEMEPGLEVAQRELDQVRETLAKQADAEPEPPQEQEHRVHQVYFKSLFSEVPKEISVAVWFDGDLERLEATFESLASQTRPFWEVMVLGEQAGFLLTTETWQKRLPRLNSGIIPAYQGQDRGWTHHALESVQAEYLCLLAGGDRLSPDFCASAMSPIEKGRDPDLIVIRRQPPGPGPDRGFRRLPPPEAAAQGDQELLLERGFVVRRCTWGISPVLLGQCQWYAPWFLAVTAALRDRGPYLLDRPQAWLAPEHPWPGRDGQEGGEADQRALAWLLKSLAHQDIKRLRPLLAQFLPHSRLTPRLLEAMLADEELFNQDSLAILHQPLWRRLHGGAPLTAPPAAQESQAAPPETPDAPQPGPQARPQGDAAPEFEAMPGPEAAPEPEATQPGEPGQEASQEAAQALARAIGQGREAILGGHLAQAQAIFLELAQSHPQVTAVHTMLSVVQQGMGQTEEAMRSLHQALALEPGNPELLARMEQLAQRPGRP